MLSYEEVHFRGQYYTQTGRQLNVAFAREIPSIGSVIAMELGTRRPPYRTFPIYMSVNLDKAFPGALSTGFLPPRFSVVRLNPDAADPIPRLRACSKTAPPSAPRPIPPRRCSTNPW